MAAAAFSIVALVTFTVFIQGINFFGGAYRANWKTFCGRSEEAVRVWKDSVNFDELVVMKKVVPPPESG
jgi:hypothetical protein